MRKQVFAVVPALFTIGALCSDSTSPPAVASVQITSTYTNPRVGEVSHVVAIPVNEGGILVEGVTCAYQSSVPAVGSVTSGDGTVSALSVGATLITAICGGKSNAITITVRPQLRTLTLNRTGAGIGMLFATPSGGSYEQSTVVSIAATADSGSAFAGFTGACNGAASPCSVTMSLDQIVNAMFLPSETFKSVPPYSATMNSVSDGNCTYSVTATGINLTVDLATNGATLMGIGVYTASISVVPTGGACTGNPFSVNVAGVLTVSGSSVSGLMRSPTTSHYMSITGTRSGPTIAGDATITEVLRNQNGQAFTSSGPFAFSLARLP